MLASYLFWLIAAIIISSFLIISIAMKTKYSIIVGISFIMLSFMAFSTKSRLDLFDPIQSIPNSEISYLYQHHKFKATDNGFYVILWLTRVDNSEETVYNFPYLGNEDLKGELDKLRKMIIEKKVGTGPYKIGGGKSGTLVVEGLKKITRPANSYENLVKGME